MIIPVMDKLFALLFLVLITLNTELSVTLTLQYYKEEHYL